MAYYMDFVVLDVGQGTGNFIEFREWGSDQLLHTVLIDLGSEGAKKEAGGPSVEYVVYTLKQMQQPTIDLLLLSHSDLDHINLLDSMLGAFSPFGSGKPANDTLLIKRVLYGGDYGRYGKKTYENVLIKIAKYMVDANEMKALAFLASSFDEEDPAPFATFLNDAEFYFLMGNANNPATKHLTTEFKSLGGYFINANSLVVSVVFGGIQMVATGDATGITLLECNRVLTKEVKKRFFDKVRMVTMPHHGSISTTLDFKGKKEVTPEENLTTFSKNLAATSISASAERNENFRHPSAEVMKYFWEWLWSDGYNDPYIFKDGHFYMAYFRPEDGLYEDLDGEMVAAWPDQAGWYTVQTRGNIFTNLYFDRDRQTPLRIPPNPAKMVDLLDQFPALGVAWCFRATEDGHTEIRQITNRRSLLRLREAILAGVPPSDLPVPTPEQLRADDEAEQLAREKRSARRLRQIQASVLSSAPLPRSKAMPFASTRLSGLKVIP